MNDKKQKVLSVLFLIIHALCNISFQLSVVGIGLAFSAQRLNVSNMYIILSILMLIVDTVVSVLSLAKLNNKKTVYVQLCDLVIFIEVFYIPTWIKNVFNNALTGDHQSFIEHLVLLLLLLSFVIERIIPAVIAGRRAKRSTGKKQAIIGL